MDLLTLSVGTLAQSFEPLYAEDSIDRAITILRGSSSRIAPVIEDGRFIGVVTDRSLIRILGEGIDRTLPAKLAIEEGHTIPVSATGAEALRILNDSNAGSLVVINTDGEPVGLIATSDLFPRTVYRPVPPMIGGMATPFGVYLTCGTAKGGVSYWALVATGAMLSFLFMGADLIFAYIYPFLPRNAFFDATQSGYVILIFMIAMRSLPLAGTHAAEHMVVHALERGEALKADVVKRMPRVHPRCGTNLAVGLMMFGGLAGLDLRLPPEYQEVQWLFAALITFLTYKKLGGLVQLFITTRPPNEKQIKSGIFAADDLLENYGKTRRNNASVGQRILNMGFLHVMAGAFAVTILGHYLRVWLDLPVGW